MAANFRSRHISPAWRRRLRYCRSAGAPLAPQIPVGVLDVAAQLLALLRRQRPLLRSVLAVAVSVNVAHVVAHALALVFAHALLLARADAFLVAFAALRKRRRGGDDQGKDDDEALLTGRDV